MILRLRKLDAAVDVFFKLHPEYKFADVVAAMDQALLENKRVAIVTIDDEQHFLDLKQYRAFALMQES